ncbi:MAG: amidohydrolase [Clostridiales bacterium]|nr:amidohydrolase [Clostridiales bacterium]
MARKAEMILYGNVFTGTDDASFRGGVAIGGERILAVGTREELEAYRTADTQIRDFGDALIMPGFGDAHAHFMMGAQFTSEHFCADLSAAKSEEECVRMMVAFAEKYPDLERYFGYGWLTAYWDDAPFPTKRSLDVAFPDKPVYLRAVDGHSEWMNQKALEESGYLSGWQPVYGSVDRFPDGELNGLVREGGDGLCRRYDTKLPAKEEEQLQRALIRSMNAKGITTCTDMDATPPEQIDDAYRYLKKMDDAGELTVRMFLYPGTETDPARIGELAPYRRKYDTDTLRIAGVKGFADGVTSTFTAAMVEPYEGRADKGYLNYPREQYLAWVKEANRQGYGARVHCIGDYAVKTLLDAFEESARVNDVSGLRNSIEHIEMIRPEDIGRFAALHVIPSMQPLHLPLDEFDKINHCGAERSHYEWVLKSILDTGASLALGTDYPVADFDPIPNIYAAVTRKGLNRVSYGPYTQKEKLTVAETLKAYTYGTAYAVGMEEKLGTLEAGKYADIAVIDRNLLTIPEEEIPESEVICTVMNGRVVFDASEQ